MTTTVQRYWDRSGMFASGQGGYVTFEDYQRDVAAAERRGAEKGREAAAKICDEDTWVDAAAEDIRSLSIEEILK